jgi:tyrosyl-tRNA synthetase
MQLGGSDQWGNIVTGIDLTRRVDGQEVYGLTSPLITTAAGSKMGKSASGAIWLNNESLSSFDFWQFWRNTADADVEKFLGLFTELPMGEVRRLGRLQGAEINEAKIILANLTSSLCHGEEAAQKAAKTAQTTFDQKGMSDGLPKIEIDVEAIEGLELIAALKLVGFAKSNGEARRLIRGGGAKVNDIVMIDENKTLSQSNFVSGKAKISAGKKRHAIIVIC